MPRKPACEDFVLLCHLSATRATPLPCCSHQLGTCTPWRFLCRTLPRRWRQAELSIALSLHRHITNKACTPTASLVVQANNCWQHWTCSCAGREHLNTRTRRHASLALVLPDASMSSSCNAGLQAEASCLQQLFGTRTRCWELGHGNRIRRSSAC